MSGKICAAVAAVVCVIAAKAETVYFWGAVDGVYDGVFTDVTHWTAEDGSSGTVPDVNGHADFSRANGSYTITFPDGVYTNFARLSPSVYVGKTVVLDGRDTVLVHPENTEGTYSTSPFSFNLNRSVRGIMGFYTQGASPNPTTSPQFVWSNFYMTATHPSSRDVSLVVDGGEYDFLHPCGHNWDWSMQKPFIYFFSLNNNDATSHLDLMDNMTATFNGATLMCPVMSIQGNANTNVLTFSGGRYKFGVVEMPAQFDGGCIAERATYTEFVIDGAVIDITNRFNLVNWAAASQRVERVVLKNGTKMLVPGIDMVGNHTTKADVSIVLDGSEITFGLNGSRSQVLNKGPFSFAATNGSTVVFDHKGIAPGGNGHAFELGDSSAAAAPGRPIRHFFRLEDSAAKVLPGAKFVAYAASVSFKDSLFNNSGTTGFYGNSGGMPLDITFDGSVFTNGSAIAIGSIGPASVVLTNGASIVTAGEMRFGGGSEGAVTTPSYAEVEITDGTIECVSGGKVRIGNAGGASAKMTMRSGRIFDWPSCTIETFSVGFAGIGEFDMYGGDVNVFRVGVGTLSRSDYTHTQESVFRMYGGEMIVRCAGNGENLGLVVGEGATRKGRLVLNGGRVTAYTVCGGAGAVCRGGTGYAALEADGGTVRAISATVALIHDFDSATLGEKGLTIDSAGYDVTVQQSFADKDGVQGLLLLKGDGKKTMTGDLSAVSKVVAEGGSVAFTGTSPLGALAVGDGATLILDPAVTLAVESVSLGDFTVSLSAACEVGDVVDFIKSKNAPDAATVAAWKKIYIASGLPDGAACDMECIQIDGEHVLRMTVRAAATTEVSLAEGTETRSDDISITMYDTLAATVGAGADLTLTGEIGKGRLVKSGDGALRLSNVGNLFFAGFLLDGGSLSVADPAALSVGPFGTMEAKHGVLEVLGPAGGAAIDGRIKMIQESTNDIFIVKNEVDLEMPCPDGNGTTGEFVKRGAGTLTLEVDGTRVLTGGNGYGQVNNNHIGWAISSIKQLAFDETSGMVTTSGVWPMSVVEGELRMVGIGENAKVELWGSALIGTSTKTGTVQPGLVLDNVTLHQRHNQQSWLHLAPAINYSVSSNARTDDFVTDPYVILTNGAHLINGALQISRFGDSYDLRPRIEVDGSVLELTSFYLNRAQSNKFTPRVVFRNGSTAYIRNFYLGYTSEVVFDGSLAARDSSLDFAVIVPESSGSTTSTGNFLFRNGSTLYCNKVAAGNLNLSRYSPLTLAFDDSTWVPARTNFVFSFDPERVTLAVTNTGMRLPVPDGRTWTMNHRVTGTGGLVNDGEGTLVLGSAAVAYGGATVAGAGAVVDLGGNAVPLKLGGAGTFVNGTVASGGVKLELDDAGAALAVPTIASGVSFSGTVRVSVGRTAQTALEEPYPTFDVLKYEGDAPDVSAFRLRDTGVSRLGGTFTVDTARKTVVCTPEKLGLVVEIR